MSLHSSPALGKDTSWILETAHFIGVEVQMGSSERLKSGVPFCGELSEDLNIPAPLIGESSTYEVTFEFLGKGSSVGLMKGKWIFGITISLWY
jgi:hypothetical protein